MTNANGPKKAKAVGINHVALEVDDIDAALDFYGAFLEFELESKSDMAAFIYFGDQFINFAKGRSKPKTHSDISVSRSMTRNWSGTL